MTDQQLNDRLRFLLTGDDGSVKLETISNNPRLQRSIRAFAEHVGMKEHMLVAKDYNNNRLTGWPLQWWMWIHRVDNPWKYALESYVDNYREPAPDMAPLEIIEECRKRGVFVWLEPITEWARAYEVCRRENGMTIREVCSVDDLIKTIKQAAISGLEAIRSIKR